MKKKTAIIIGAGPAGLTAAYELLKKTNITPIVIEKTNFMGGISRTVNYKGNRIDIGGHRFFSKSDRVMNWWSEIMNEDEMLVRSRKSRIYFNKTFFDYPIALTPKLIKSLGILETFLIGCSYLKRLAFPVKKEKSLEDFLINRFGTRLYKTFFKSYTEKVWGVPCSKISADWGAQRIKGVSGLKTILHFFKSIFQSKKSIEQKNIETSLIARFLYPKHGPGEMWELVAKKVIEMGGKIITDRTVCEIQTKGDKVVGVSFIDEKTDEMTTLEADCFLSSMPIQDFVHALDEEVPPEVKQISDGLVYRDFITVGLLVKKLKVSEKDGSMLKDNWIYIQERDVKLGRLQIFNNWSPHMVADPNTVWLGLEYFCNEGDELWNLSDKAMIDLGKKELSHIGIIDQTDVIDATVIRQEKAYPAYFGTYNKFDVLKNYLNFFSNTFFIGRNGMHRYNNQDHSMLSAIYAVENIRTNVTNNENIWSVNTEQDYHESRTS